MQLIRGLHNIRPAHQGCVATIGNFDGVHCGHRAILQSLRARACQQNTRTCVITFEPLPREHFHQDSAPARLTTLREKLFLLEQCQVDQVLCLPFDHRLSTISADDFVTNILVKGLNVRYLIVGDDFRFGYGRRGSFQHLVKRGQQYGFAVSDTETVTQASERISSTRIRQALDRSALTEANQLLGHPLIMMGKVRRGQRLGRQLGFPTANICAGRHNLPVKGVYVARVYHGGRWHGAVANLGTRPTVSSNKPWLEVHLLDFTGDLYGQLLRVEFIEKLRDEKKFESLPALRAAIAGDALNARRLINHSFCAD
ncbi:bifunctional riboflavin kinase/FAD synthetase [Candidatus Sororendozoicomonas aggregata]|uniref:bifunctional riboflavin kinase/FAD synthetase n=1 Tax=Candidatus Sororendozoicomonas aggregata TaxID=3073239 RepID=UPI002ED2DAA2